MKKWFSTLLLIGLLIPQLALAKVQLLATVHRTSDEVYSKLLVDMDKNGDAQSFIFRIYEEDGSLDREVTVTPRELPEGKVVLEKMGVDVISIASQNFASHNGGHIDIIYLKKWKLFGSNETGTLEVLLDRVGNGWLLKLDGKPFTELLAHDHSKGINKFSVVK